MTRYLTRPSSVSFRKPKLKTCGQIGKESLCQTERYGSMGSLETQSGWRNIQSRSRLLTALYAPINHIRASLGKARQDRNAPTASSLNYFHPIILDHRIRQDVMRELFDLRAGARLINRFIQFDLEVFPLPHVGDGSIADGLGGVMDRFALRIEHPVFQRHVNFSQHLFPSFRNRKAARRG